MRLLVLTILAMLVAQPLGAQRLRERISQLFVLRPGDEPLFLAGSATVSNPAAIRAHGTHFLPSVAAENGSVIGFLTGALAGRIAAVPIGSTTGGETFRFEGGVPVSTSTSAGPIFGERSQTLGRGRVLAGVTRSSLNFATLRGVRLDDLRLVFTHQNVDFPGCDDEQSDDCTKMGVPVLENDVMTFDLSLDIDVDVTSFYVTYGLSDRIDLGVVLPIVQTRFAGHSVAQIIPFGGTSAAHFFGGTPQDPELLADRTSSGSAFGVGDIAARVKINAAQSGRTGVGILADLRFPTGDEQDLLGSGKFAGRIMGIMSSTFGDFSPHANLGYLFTDDSTTNDAIIATLGFDHLLGSRVTLAAEVLSEFQVGSSALVLPREVQYTAPFRRSVNPTNIPDVRDNLVSGSFGFKFSTPGKMTVVTNALFPLNDAGLRSQIIYTLGVEYAF
jgi:hypothetical protein